jgi:hypothetical protein
VARQGRADRHAAAVTRCGLSATAGRAPTWSEDVANSPSQGIGCLPAIGSPQNLPQFLLAGTGCHFIAALLQAG